MHNFVCEVLCMLNAYCITGISGVYEDTATLFLPMTAAIFHHPVMALFCDAQHTLCLCFMHRFFSGLSPEIRLGPKFSCLYSGR